MNTSGKSGDILPYLQKLNEQLEVFIQSTLEISELVKEQELNLLPDEDMHKIPKCWIELQCKRIECPCYESRDYRCWLVAGTLCGGKPQGTFAQKYGSCYTCKVFKNFTDTTVRALYENIGILIKHLGDKARQAREFGLTDNLTGLYNRHYLDIIKKREIKNTERRSVPLSIIIFDINKLKMVNDTYGHLIGDKTIKEFSAFLQKYTRESDFLFRLGGDEFLLLMNDADEKQCEIFEKRLHNAIEEWNKSRKGAIPMSISFSSGSATAFPPINFDELIAEADKRMYADKQAKQD
jgi:diguanylate cyclase (GGDEF)-like protein